MNSLRHLRKQLFGGNIPTMSAKFPSNLFNALLTGWFRQTNPHRKICAGKDNKNFPMIPAEIQISAELKLRKLCERHQLLSKTQWSTIIKNSFDYFIHIFISPHYINFMTALRIFFFTNFLHRKCIYPGKVLVFHLKGVRVCILWWSLAGDRHEACESPAKTHCSVRCDRDNVGTLRSDSHKHSVS